MNRRPSVLALLFVLLCPLGCRAIESDIVQEEFTLTGLVQREDKTSVQNAFVTIYEEPRRKFWTTAPIAGKIIAKGSTDERGRFMLTFSALDRNRLTLSVIGEVKNTTQPDGTIVSSGTDVAVDSIQFENENLIVVPNDFVPAKRRQKPTNVNPGDK